jgi:hypothetical protein
MRSRLLDRLLFISSLALFGCETSSEDEVADSSGGGTYNSISNLSVSPSGTSLTQTPPITWQLGFPVFSSLEVGLGSSPTSGANVKDWNNVGVATTAILTGLGLSQCTDYYPMVRAKSAAGNVLDTHVVTTPFSVDLANPTVPSALTVTENGTSTKSATLSWTASTDNCALTGYQYAVGTTSGGTETVNWSPLGVVTSHQVTTGATFNYGTLYYTSLKSLDRANNESTVATTSSWRLRSPFAHLAGTQTIASADFHQGSSYMRWSFSSVDSAYFSHSTLFNPETLTVLQSGDYILYLTMPLQVSATCTGRCSIKASVLVNGVAVPAGLANSSYVINASGFNESSNHLRVYLNNLSVNDEIEIYLERGTTQAGSLVSEGVQAYIEAVLPGRNLFHATSTQTTASTDLNQVATQNLSWNQVETSAPFTFNSGTPGQITLNSAGNYLVSVNVPMEAVGVCTTRNNVRVNIALNGTTVTGGFANQAGIDCVNGHLTGSAHWMGVLQGVTAGQILTVGVTREGTSANTIQVEAGRTASITIERLSSIENYISLSGTRTVASTNWNGAVASPIQWNTQVATDATHFTHSTVANNHQVTVTRAGNYLVLFNDHLSTVTARTNVRVRLQKNGADVVGGLCTSNIITNANGNNEGTCAMMYYLSGIAANDVITLTAAQEAAAGTVNSVSPALLTIIRVK